MTAARILAQYHPPACTCHPCSQGRIADDYPWNDAARVDGTPPPFAWAMGKPAHPKGRDESGVCNHDFIPSPFSSLGICQHCGWQRWAR